MARMIPSAPDASTPSSELSVFESFRHSLPDSWTVLHARRFVLPATEHHPRAQEGEVDFLILDRDRGLLGLEVKGGSIQRDAAGWTSIDRFGHHHPIKDPGAQAQSAVHKVGRYIAGHPTFNGHSRGIPFGWGVVFPDIHLHEGLGPELPRELLLDRDDLEDAREAVDRVFAAAGLTEARIRRKNQEALIATLAPTVNRDKG